MACPREIDRLSYRGLRLGMQANPVTECLGKIGTIEGQELGRRPATKQQRDCEIDQRRVDEFGFLARRLSRDPRQMHVRWHMRPFRLGGFGPSLG